MANVLTLDGNLTQDPELRHTKSGLAVTNVNVAHNKRIFNKESGEWENGEPLFVKGAVWRKAATNVAESLKKGDPVIVTGELKQSSYEKDGEKRTVFELNITHIGPDLMRATAEVTRNQSKSGSDSAQSTKKSAPEPETAPAAEAADDDEDDDDAPF